MEQFAYSFIITMLHSIWQMALLLLIYFTAISISGKWQPLAKRNLLLFLMAIQVLFSISSFYFIYSAPFFDYRESMQDLLLALGSSQTWMLEYSNWIFAAYAVALLYKLIATVMSWIRFRNVYTGNLIKASAEIRNFTTQTANRFGIQKKVQVWYSKHIQSPIVFGFLKPVILLPVAIVNQLSVCQAEALIIHELTHIRYKDYLFNWFLLCTEAIYFFNPFVKIAIRHIKTEREKNCDVHVLQFNYSAVGYAEALLMIARQQLQPVQVPVAAVSKSNELLKRIRYFSSPNNSKEKNSFKTIPFVALMLMGLFFASAFLTGLRLSSGPEKYSTVKLTNSFVIPSEPVTENSRIITTEAYTANESVEYENDATLERSALEEKINAEKTKETAKAEQATLKQIQEETAFNLQETDHLITSVSFANAAPLDIKNMIINEESSDGTSVTKIIRITQNADGSWHAEPLIMISEKLLNDSLKNIIRKDSNVIHIIPTVQ